MTTMSDPSDPDPDKLFSSVMKVSGRRLQNTLLGMSGPDCAATLDWLVTQIESNSERIDNFAALVHRVYGNKLKHHPEVSELMVTKAYVKTIADRAERGGRTKSEKIKKKDIITGAWGTGWMGPAAPCMFYAVGVEPGLTFCRFGIRSHENVRPLLAISCRHSNCQRIPRYDACFGSARVRTGAAGRRKIQGTPI
jgi:hypothetical protein